MTGVVDTDLIFVSEETKAEGEGAAAAGAEGAAETAEGGAAETADFVSFKFCILIFNSSHVSPSALKRRTLPLLPMLKILLLYFKKK